jgi:hypothetical protein
MILILFYRFYFGAIEARFVDRPFHEVREIEFFLGNEQPPRWNWRLWYVHIPPLVMILACLGCAPHFGAVRRLLIGGYQPVFDISLCAIYICWRLSSCLFLIQYNVFHPPCEILWLLERSVLAYSWCARPAF